MSLSWGASAVSCYIVYIVAYFHMCVNLSIHVCRILELCNLEEFQHYNSMKRKQYHFESPGIVSICNALEDCYLSLVGWWFIYNVPLLLTIVVPWHSLGLCCILMCCFDIVLHSDLYFDIVLVEACLISMQNWHLRLPFWSNSSSHLVQMAPSQLSQKHPVYMAQLTHTPSM